MRRSISGRPTWRTIAVLASVVVALGACSGGGPTSVAAEDRAFAERLAADYARQLNDPAVVAASGPVRQRIDSKRSAAEARQRTAPEVPSEWAVVPTLATGLLADRAALNRALDAGGRRIFPEAAARAQSAFDCVVLAHVDPALTPLRSSCEATFRQSLSAVERSGITGQPRGLANDLVFFGSGSDRLTAAGQGVINQLTDGRTFNVSEAVGPTFLIHGHVDRGSESAVPGLAGRRAETVRSALIARDVPADRIEIRSSAAAAPLSGGASMNRRTDIWVL